MNLSEKLFQKLNNLKSKKAIKDFFVVFDEVRSLNIKQGNQNTEIIKENFYFEECYGDYTIVWDDKYYSTGKISAYFVEEFEHFIEEARSSKLKYESSIFIPERGIYPITVSYSKVLADMIDIPEYLLKLSDLTLELDQMTKADPNTSTSSILVIDGLRYGFSSKKMEESYSYTKFIISKRLEDKLNWNHENCDILSIAKFQELLSFLGNAFTTLKEDKIVSPKGKTQDILLSPNLFKKVFYDQVISNLNAENVLHGESAFTPEHLDTKEKIFGIFSLSYDPLMNNRPGTYCFTKDGAKPSREYFIKFGKIDSFISNNLNFSKFNLSQPSLNIESFSNFKFEGVKKRLFQDVQTSSEKPLLLIISETFIEQKSFTENQIFAENVLLLDKKKIKKAAPVKFFLSLIEKIAAGEIEIVEFVDEQLGVLVKNVKIEGFA